MPISEDGLDDRNQQSNNEPTSTMSKAELRKTHKPIMEKRRRARINHCLNEIKTLILEAMKKDPARHSKLEKADILEMAVKHLQNVQRQQLAMAIAGDPSVLRKFKTGFDECAREISIYISQIDERQVATGLNDRITTHLTKCIGGIEQIARFNFPGFPTFVTDVDADANGILATASRNETVTDDMMNNNPQMQRQQETSSSIRLIPSRLPTGELAFLVPNSFANLSNLSSLLGGETNTNFESDKRRNSAFVTVTPSSNLSSLNQQLLRQNEESSISTISPPPSPAHVEESPTAKGFRPVNSTALQRSYRSAFLSTAKLVRNSEDLKKHIEYSHHQLTFDKNSDNNNSENSDRKIAEPLCVITNQSERFKHAQVPEETVDCEENIRGVKRKRHDNAPETDTSPHCGFLMASVPNNQDPCQSKIPKASNGDYPSQFRRHPRYNLMSQANMKEKPTGTTQTSSQSSGRHCDDNSESGNDMWRPW